MKALVIDDHVLIREALHGVMAELPIAVELLEAASAVEARRVMETQPDVELILLDLQLTDARGLELLEFLRAHHPEAGIVVLSATCDRELIAMALDRGAVGFIPKTTSHEVMLGALRLVLDGGVYVPPEILGAASPQSPRTVPERPRIPGLTMRQLDVLHLMMQGMSNKAIARRLGLSEPTVKAHVTSIFRAFNVSNRTEAVLRAAAYGHPPTPGS